VKSFCFVRTPSGEIVETGIDGEGTRAEPGMFQWVHLEGRDPANQHWLGAKAGIPAPVVRALTAVETRPRTETIGDGALINLRGLGATPEDDPDKLVSIRLWAEKGRVISVGFRSLAALPLLREQMRAGQVRDPGDLIAALAIAITGSLDSDIAEMGDELDDCEVSLDADRAYTMRTKIARTRSEAIGYRRFVVPQRQALERLADLDVDWLEDDAALMHEQLTDLRAELIETRTLVLSIVALVFLPLTFLTGLLGMNVDGIPYAHRPWAFWGVVGVSAAIAVAITVYFARAQWFRR
jgi:zinc transporter